jgi:hypothetical protein
MLKKNIGSQYHSQTKNFVYEDPTDVLDEKLPMKLIDSYTDKTQVDDHCFHQNHIGKQNAPQYHYGKNGAIQLDIKK